MNESKQIEVNSSSIIDLKAELYRKQETFRLKKLSQSQQKVVENDTNLYEINCNQIKYKLGKRIREKNDKELIENHKRKYGHKAVEDREKATEEQMEVEKALQRSKQMLEKKTLLYEKLSKNPNLLNIKDDDSEEESDDRILVDFQRKSAIEISTENDIKEEDNDSEEEWTEFVDSLGRTRKCLKKDLQQFLDIDRQTFRPKKTEDIPNKGQNTSDLSSVPNLSTNNELLSSDLRRELERRDWETNARNEVTNERTSGLKTNDLNIHYQNVKNNEIRDHGVAYYAFDEDHTTRQQQMDLLNQLRDQTMARKQQKLKLKQKRKQLLRERLAKVAQRKGIAFEPKDSSSDSSDEEPVHMEPEVLESRPMPSTVREWDVGKPELHEVLSELRPKSKPVFNSHKTYINERRDERNPDFAPPSAYVKPRNELKHKFSDKRTEFKSETNKRLDNEKPNSSIGSNFNDINENHNKNKTQLNTDSNKLRPDVNQVISNALSYFRNHLKQ